MLNWFYPPGTSVLPGLAMGTPSCTACRSPSPDVSTINFPPLLLTSFASLVQKRLPAHLVAKLPLRYHPSSLASVIACGQALIQHRITILSGHPEPDTGYCSTLLKWWCSPAFPPDEGITWHGKPSLPAMRKNTVPYTHRQDTRQRRSSQFMDGPCHIDASASRFKLWLTAPQFFFGY